MARMHSRKRGKAGSKRPMKKAVPAWVIHSKEEVELLVEKIAKEEKSPSQIGVVLRDSYGIPDVAKITGKSIIRILSEKKMEPEIPEDLMELIKKSVRLKKHREENRHDMTAKRGTELTESKIRRLVKYYKRENVLASDWNYDPEKVRLIIS